MIVIICQIPGLLLLLLLDPDLVQQQFARVTAMEDLLMAGAISEARAAWNSTEALRILWIIPIFRTYWLTFLPIQGVMVHPS